MPVNRFDRTAYSDGSESAGDSTEESVHGGPEALRRLQAQLEALGDYARWYADAKKDAMLVTVRKLVLWTAAGVIGFAIVCTMIVAATVLGMIGLAQLIGTAVGDRIWAGNLVVGFGFVLLIAVGLIATITIVQRQSRKRTEKKYGERHEAQRSRYGHDVAPAGSSAERN